MTKVLLTGAGGFVGSHTLIHLLHNTDWELVLTDSFRHKGKTDRITQQLNSHPEYRDRVTVLTHDLTVPFSGQMVERMGEIDYIISMASESHVDRSIVEPRPFIENNVQLVLTLLEYAREVGVKKFIHVSTDEVYGPVAVNEDPHVEGDVYRPSNPYAASKAAQENIAFSYWRTYDVPLIITNTMNIFGELQEPEKYVPFVIKQVSAGDEVIVHVDPEGVPGSRFYLHARNQADALRHILATIEPVSYRDGVSKPSQYHVVGEVEVDNLTMAELIAGFMGKELRYQKLDFHSSRPGHDRRYALDGTALAETGWTAPVPFEDSLRRTIQWTLEHPAWLLG